MNPKQQVVSEDDWAEWLQHPTTQVFQALMRRRREDLKEQWAGGEFSEKEHVAAIAKDARAFGACQMLASLLELDAIAVNGEMSDE